MKQTARIIRNNVPLTLLPNGVTYGEPLHCPTVAAARLLPDPPPPCISIGSASSDITGTYFWDSASTATDDGQTVIKVDAILVGRYRPVATGDGGPPSGEAGGHLALTYPDPVLANGRGTISDLRALTVRANRSEIHVGETNRAYRYDTTVGAGIVDNNYDCIKPNDVLEASNGRWIGLGETDVPTVDTLRTLTSGFSAKVFVRGFAGDGDGGGGHFVKRTGSATDDGGTVIVPTGVSTFYYERLYSGALNVRWFGAKGDGVTDDTAAIQAALDNGSGAYGKSVYLPATDVANNKWYRITSPLVIRRSIRFFGDSGPQRGSSRITPDGGVGGIVVDTTAFGGVAIEDIACTCVTRTGSAVGLILKARANISRCEFGAFGSHGIEIDGGLGNCNSWSVKDSVSRNNVGYGVYAHGQEANAGLGQNIQCADNGEAGIADMSFLGNTWVQCECSENGANHPWLPGIDRDDPRLSYKTIEPDGSNSGVRTPLFVNCYFEGDNVPLLGPGSMWLGYVDSVRQQLEFDQGMYLLPSYSRNMSGQHVMTGDVSVLQWSIGQNSPDSLIPRVLFFRDTRRADGYHLAYDTANSSSARDDMWSMAWGAPAYAPWRAFGLSDLNFERGPAKFVLPNAYVVQSETSEVGGVSKMRFYGPKPLEFVRGNGTFYQTGLPWQNGDSFEYTTVSDGGYKGKVCTRGGFYGDPWQANTPYVVGLNVVASPDNGHVYRCTTAGTTHATTQPTWNTGSGSTTSDNGVVWTEIGTSSLWKEWGYIGTGGGPAGADGADGAPGSLWYQGAGVPSGGTGIDGDLYLRTATNIGDVYQKAAGTWSVIGNIRGATGATGSTGATGPAGAQVRRKDGISGNTSYGYAGSSPDTTLTENWTILKLTPDGDYTITLKRTGAPTAAVIEVAVISDGNERTLFFNDETSGSLCQIDVDVTNTINNPKYVKLVFWDSTDGWRPLNMGGAT